VTTLIVKGNNTQPKCLNNRPEAKTNSQMIWAT